MRQAQVTSANQNFLSFKLKDSPPFNIFLEMLNFRRNQTCLLAKHRHNANNNLNGRKNTIY